MARSLGIIIGFDPSPTLKKLSFPEISKAASFVLDKIYTTDPVLDKAKLRTYFGVDNLPVDLKLRLWPGYIGPFVRNTSLPT